MLLRILHEQLPIRQNADLMDLLERPARLQEENPHQRL